MEDGLAESGYPEVRRALTELLDGVSPDAARIARKVEELAAEHGDQIYTELLYWLCHLTFAGDEARSHWEGILRHRESLAGKLATDVDLRVALLDYFVSVNRHFQNPKIIEIQIFQKTLDSAMRDELTGLYNYRFVRHELERELARAQRTGVPLSVALFDVDYFKWYNDRNGHLRGDDALRLVAKLMLEEVRCTDLVGRYGGEEFVVILPDTDKTLALAVAERICSRIAAHDFPLGDGQPGGIFSVSGGVASYGADAVLCEGLVDAADQALYQAKATGKNRVLAAGSEFRSSHRQPAALSGRLQTMAPESLPILTENISEQGLQFRSSSQVPPGEVFRISLQLPESAGEIDAIARAVRVDEVDGRYTVGAQFVEISHERAAVLRRYLESQAVAVGV